MPLPNFSPTEDFVIMCIKGGGLCLLDCLFLWLQGGRLLCVLLKEKLSARKVLSGGFALVLFCLVGVQRRR